MSFVGALGLLSVLATTAAASFELVTSRSTATILIATSEPECVQLAVNDLVSDVHKITGRTLVVVRRPEECGPNRIVVASVNQPESAALLVRLAPEVTDQLMGKWESYQVRTVGSALVVAGSDERGTMFGLYAFIESHLGVDPLSFWSSRTPKTHSTLAWDSVSLGSGEPTFKFRGWFINDEDLLTEWKEPGGDRSIDYPYYAKVVPRETMRAIAEALVRSRCNLIIPASFVDILNPPEEALVQECARRGVFVSQHHVEPLGVSAFSYFNYWKKRGRELKYSYFSHPEEVREVWRVYAEKWATYRNVIWQLGLRGIADRPMWMADPATPQSDADRGRLISEAMDAQVKILDQVGARQPRYLTTTLWAEGSQLNEKNLLSIPPGTIVIFSDNSPGWKWQRDFHTTRRQPEHRHGVYYHHALIGSGPHLAQVPSPHKTHECLELAVSQGASTYAIFNVSNLREFVLGIDASAKMTWNLAAFEPDQWLKNWVSERFSRDQAAIENAYRAYFNTWQIHATRGVPFLMDGQMFSTGRSGLDLLAKKLRSGQPGEGAPPEPVLQVNDSVVEPAKSGPDNRDSFWAGIRDMHPQSTRGQRILAAGAQRAGFSRVILHTETLSDRLPDEEARFLKDNLGFQAALALQLSTWVEAVELANESFDLNNLARCKDELHRAEAAFSQIPVLAESYCWGPWEHWYRGSKKLNITATQQRTRDVLQLAIHAPPPATR